MGCTSIPHSVLSMRFRPLFPLLLLAVLLQPAHADETTPVRVYLDQIRDRETGIYEIDGRLYANIRVPERNPAVRGYDPELRAKAELNKRVRQWVLDRAIQARQARNPLPEGLARLERLCAEEEPQWFLGNWSWQSAMQSFPGRRIGSEYVYGFAFPRSDLESSVPALSGSDMEIDALFAATSRLARKRMAGGNRDDFLSGVGAFDLIPEHPFEDSVGQWWAASSEPDLARKAFSEVFCGSGRRKDTPSGRQEAESDKVLLSWILDSEPSALLVETARDVSRPRERVERRFGPAEIRVETNVVCSVSTNRMEISEQEPAVNPVEWTWAETPSGISAMPAGNRVKGTVVSHPVEIVTTNREVSIRTTTRFPIVEEKTVVSGDPRFEALLLSGATISNAPSARTAIGREAESAFYNAKLQLLERRAKVERGLRENPGDAGLWNLLGRCFQGEEDHAAAVICFRNALRIDPAHGFALANLGVSYQSLGFSELAFGCSVAVLGMTDDPWCINQARAILKAEWNKVARGSND